VFERWRNGRRCLFTNDPRARADSLQERRELNMSTLQVWCIPTDVSQDLDHTFVYCPDNKKIFGCWNSGDIARADAAMVASASYPAAYETADCYRCPVFEWPDTAGVGVYGVNGVCHQSANRFYFAVSSSPIVQVNGRPGGLPLSCFAYGNYGTTGGILGPGIEFVAFLTLYNSCVKSLGVGERGGQPPELGADNLPLARELRQLYETAAGRNVTPNELIVQESAILATHMASTDVSGFASSHQQLLARKDELIKAGWDGQSKVVSPDLAGKLNSWAVTLQREMAGALGSEAFGRLMGTAPESPLMLIDLNIVNQAWPR
jgi:hypothetical protein